ncbi:MAG: DNA-binding SARP family transcriptional activator [Clostridium sp.]|jgi:DNA-binding SARP family transcriptional activator
MSLNAKFLGQLDFIFNGESITSSLSQKACGLLCYLMMNSGKTHYREQLAGIFWGNSDVYSANSSLRYTLWIIRKNLESSGHSFKYIINSSKHTINFEEDNLDSVDVIKFKKIFSKSNERLDPNTKIDLMEEATKLYGGIFLNYIYIKDAPAFNDWVFFEREELQRLYFKLQINLSKEYEKLGFYDKAIVPINKLIKIDALHEDLYYQLMNLYNLSGYRTTAIETYIKLKKILREELNISPMKIVQELYQEIREEKNSLLPQQHVDLVKNELGQFITLCKEGFHMKFFMTESASKIQEISTMLNEIKFGNMSIVAQITKLPGKRVPYEGLYEILDGYLDIIMSKKDELDVDIIVCEIDRIKTAPFLGKFTLFQSLCNVFHKSEETRIIFNIYNFHLIDNETIEFLSFLTRKCSNMNILIFAIYDTNWDNERFNLFKMEFENEERIEFIIV